MSRAVTVDEPTDALAPNLLTADSLLLPPSVSGDRAGARDSSRRLVSPQPLLDWEADHLSPLALAQELLRALRRLDARDAALDLRLGEGFARLLGELGLKPLGHSRVEDFGPGRLGVSGSHVKELRWLVGKLRPLPTLRRAFLSGDIPRAKLRIVLRVATPETEAGWLVRARRFSTRDLEKDVAAFRRRESPKAAASEETLKKDDDPTQGVRVGWHCDSLDAALFRHWGKAMVRQLVGHPVTDWQVAEVLAAEALTALGGDAEGADDPEVPRFRGLVRPLRLPDGEPPASDSRPRTSRQLVALAPKSRRMLRGEAIDMGLPDVTAPSDAWSLLEILRDLMSERHGLEAERARLLALASGRSVHRTLGFRTFDDFTQRALGMAPRDVKELVELDSRLMLLPALREAWLQGCVSRLAVSLLSRVAIARTEDDWLAWARLVSFKRLEIETEWHQTMRATLPLREYLQVSEGGRPLRGAPTRTLHLPWRRLLAALGRSFACDDPPDGEPAGPEAPGGACPPATEPEPDSDTDSGSDSQADAPEGACPPGASSGPTHLDAPLDSCERAALMPTGRVRVSFRCPAEVAALFERAVGCVSAALGGVADVATCVRWMLAHLARTHASPEHEARWLSHPILERAGWICSMPHCRECTALQVHHPHQRSQGGPLVPENEDADCESCHLHVIHAGHATTKGTLPDDLVVGLGASSPGGTRELWRDERLIAQAPRLTPPWRPSC